MLQGWIRSRRAWALAGLTGSALLLAAASRTLAEDKLSDAAPPALAAPPAAAPAPATPAAPAPIASPTTLPATVDGSLTTSPIPGAPAAAPGADCDPCKKDAPKPEEPKSIWAKVPPIPIFQRPGWFPIGPTGPGYYSLEDQCEGKCSKDRPKMPWGLLSPQFIPAFDWDFRYLDDPKNTLHDFWDPIKRIHCGDNWLLSYGGEVRLRQANENDSQLTGRNDNYLLQRTRFYQDLWYRDRFRVFMEYIYSTVTWQDLPPAPTDRNYSDFLDLFAEVKLVEIGDTPLYVRGGRQELAYGSQRLVSNLDWANTLRTFDGVKAYWHSPKLYADFFWARPVVPPNPTRFDSSDQFRNFSGAWFTYQKSASEAIDFYYLDLDSNIDVLNAGRGIHVPKYNVSTFGSRYVGDYDKRLLWDFEGMYQFGPYGDRSTNAGAFTTGLGYCLKDSAWQPTLWVNYDWASGSPDPLHGTHETFNQLFPFGHYYFGWIDVVGRQNITDISEWLYLYPTKWITTWVACHHFQLENAHDALYNAAGVPIRWDPSGRAGTNVGTEIDWVTNFHLTRHQNILVGYGKLYSGSFIKQTGSPRSPEYAWIQYSYRF